VLADVHQGFAWFVVIGNALAGLWALGAHRWASLRTRSLWWFTVVAEVAMFVQVALGVALVNAEDVEPPQFHLLYGFAGIIAIGILYSYRTTSPWVRDHRYLVYGLGGLFLMGLGIRAMLVSAS
jgi:hypothetical protein